MPSRDLIGLGYLSRLYKVDEKCIQKVRKIYGKRIYIKILKYIIDRNERETYYTFN